MNPLNAFGLFAALRQCWFVTLSKIAVIGSSQHSPWPVGGIGLWVSPIIILVSDLNAILFPAGKTPNYLHSLQENGKRKGYTGES
jgi:hypothetical protein